jgi:hypothetical protein
MRKNLLTTSALTIAAIAILALSTAPLPIATAGRPARPDADPCGYTRHLNADNVEFALWEAYCDDVVEALHLRHLNAEAECHRAKGTAIHEIIRFCQRHCRDCQESRSRCRHIPRRAKNMARKGKFEVGKCTWDACMDYDAIYDAARAQLDEAGYACLVQKLYVKYQYVKQHSVRFQRYSIKKIDQMTYRCRCDAP